MVCYIHVIDFVLNLVRVYYEQNNYRQSKRRKMVYAGR